MQVRKTFDLKIAECQTSHHSERKRKNPRQARSCDHTCGLFRLANSRHSDSLAFASRRAWCPRLLSGCFAGQKGS